MKAFYSLSQPSDVEQLCLQGYFAIKMLSYSQNSCNKDQHALKDFRKVSAQK